MTAEPQTLRLVAPRKKAIVYLRVSTPRQMETASDVDPEGNSIATQRQLCRRKAEAVDADIIREFVEPGNSAQTIEKRPVFRQLLQCISEQPGIDYVIIYMRSRAFRNLGDAVITKRRLEQHGIRLLSAKEDFGEGYLADAMEAVTDIFNEIEVRRNGDDISQKMQHKALGGGTIGRAKLGYLNVRVDVDGRLVNSIGVDPLRAPLVRQAFELYATGDYSLEHLSEEMADRGLRSRPSRTRPAKPVGIENLRLMLRDPYYTGAMVYKGQIVPNGRHQAIVNQDLWDRVQSVLDLRSRRGQRDRVLKHYLKGMVFCGRCKAAGRTSRMIFTQARGRGGEYYPYFLCRGRQQGVCDLPYLPAEQVEEAVALHYYDLGVGADFVEAVEAELTTFMAESQQLTRELHQSLTKQLAKLDTQEDRLIDLAAEGSLSKAKLQQRINRLRLERQRVQESLDNTGQELKLGAQRLIECVRLIANPAQLYAQASDVLRRNLNQTFFHQFYLEDGDRITVADSALKAPFDELRDAGQTIQATAANHEKGPVHLDRAPSVSRYYESHNSFIPVVRTVVGSSKTEMVGATGIEPVTARV
jgi:site-specific DNA recombinase